jgi:hypothetical protein
MDLVIFFLIIVGVGLATLSWLKADLQCPPSKVIYRYVPKHPLDVQFGEENKPSVIYNDMFTQGPPWIGGYQIGSGKTFVVKEQASKSQVQSQSQIQSQVQSQSQIKSRVENDRIKRGMNRR